MGKFKKLDCWDVCRGCGASVVVSASSTSGNDGVENTGAGAGKARQPG